MLSPVHRGNNSFYKEHHRIPLQHWNAECRLNKASILMLNLQKWITSVCKEMGFSFARKAVWTKVYCMIHSSSQSHWDEWRGGGEAKTEEQSGFVCFSVFVVFKLKLIFLFLFLLFIYNFIIIFLLLKIFILFLLCLYLSSFGGNTTRVRGRCRETGRWVGLSVWYKIPKKSIKMGLYINFILEIYSQTLRGKGPRVMKLFSNVKKSKY